MKQNPAKQDIGHSYGLEIVFERQNTRQRQLARGPGGSWSVTISGGETTTKYGKPGMSNFDGDLFCSIKPPHR